MKVWDVNTYKQVGTLSGSLCFQFCDIILVLCPIICLFVKNIISSLFPPFDLLKLANLMKVHCLTIQLLR